MTSEGAAVLDAPPLPATATPATGQPPAVPPLIKRTVIAGAVLTLLAVAGMAVHRTPTGSFAGGWRYKYVGVFSWEILWPFAAALAIVLALLWLSMRVHTRFAWTTVLGWLVAAVPLQMLLRTYDDTSLAGLVSSDRSNSFYSPTQRWSAAQFISSYMDIVDDLPAHARTNMPGKTLLYYLLGALTDSPMALGILVIAVSNIGALLVYLIVRDLASDHRAALYALILYVAMPGKIYFLPVLNVVTPVPILLALWLHVRYLRNGHWAYAALLGPALYLTCLFEPLPLVMGLVFAALTAWFLVRETLTWNGVARLVAIAVATFACCHVAMRLAFGYDIVANFAYVLQDASEYNDGRRPYHMWVTRNLWDVAVSAGLATTLLLVAGFWDTLRRGIAHPMAVLTVSGLAVLAFLDLIGINRGETVRLWIFLAAFLQITAAWLCARTPRSWPFALLLAATLLQATVGLVMIGYIRA